MSAVLELRGVTAGYGRTTVLRNVDLSVPRGKTVALIGPNGAGKTTLLRVAAGLLKPSAGTVHIDDEDLTQRVPNRRTRRGLCLIPEGRGVFRHLTVRENLRLQVPPWSKDGSIDRAIEAFPVLGGRMSQLAGSLSGGEQQMLALSRSYLADPRVVLLDEVSMGLAPKIVEEIFESLRLLAETGVSLLLVEQYITQAMGIADVVVLLDRGQVSFTGPPAQLKQDALLRGYLGIDLSTSEPAPASTPPTIDRPTASGG